MKLFHFLQHGSCVLLILGNTIVSRHIVGFNSDTLININVLLLLSITDTACDNNIKNDQCYGMNLLENQNAADNLNSGTH